MERVTYDKDHCVYCHETENAKKGKLRVVTTGIAKIRLFATSRDLQTLIKYIDNEANTVAIHPNCQKQMTNDLRKKSTNSNESSNTTAPMLKTRSTEPDFDFRRQCIFCSKVCTGDTRSDLSDFSICATKELGKNLKKMCKGQNNELAEIVHRRISSCHDNDLFAAEARYHRKCKDAFHVQSLKREDQTNARGRPQNTLQDENFSKLCDWLEMEGDLYSLQELFDKMKSLAGNDNVYSRPQYLKDKLKKKYGDQIIFATMHNKNDVVCFSDTASSMVNDAWYQSRSENSDDDSERIIKTAAKILIAELRSTLYDTSVYPSLSDIGDVEKNIAWLPKYLQIFLKSLIKPSILQASIGHAIVHAVKPRSSIPPILFGTSVEFDHLFGSKWLLSESNRLGWGLSAQEVTRFKQSVVCNERIEDYIKNSVQGGHFAQWSADNVDHNVRTLDGKGTLHGMGIVISLTGSKDNPLLIHPKEFPRQKLLKVSDVTQGHRIEFSSYIPPEQTGLSKLNFLPFDNLKMSAKKPEDTSVDLLWHAAYFPGIHSAEGRPGWSGFMRKVCMGQYPGKSEVIMLPIIDVNPSDMSCVYSTIMFIMKQAREINIEVPVLTFDQPLWLKATEIVNALSLEVVLILGGFHMLMSFTGSLGDIMKDSGISECFSTVYGSTAITHMLTGKAIARALRGHFLLESALTTDILSQLLPVPPAVVNDEFDENNLDNQSEEDMNCYEERNIEEAEDEDDEGDDDTDEAMDMGADTDGEIEQHEQLLNADDVSRLHELYDVLQNDFHKGLDLLEHSEVFQKMKVGLADMKDHLSEASRTAKLWVQYIQYVEIIKDFMRAERTGNFSFHLQTVSRMLNLFAATGHIHYAKSARLYLQQMLELETRYPWVYTNFAKNGYHTVRRSDRYWAGLWTDLVIEQVMMRSLKSRGGLTRGRGVTESVRTLWINSMHRCAEVHNAMCHLTGLQHTTSDQHVELQTSRKKRDQCDLEKFRRWLSFHLPFSVENPSLRSLSSGLMATNDDGINCDTAEQVGEMIQKKLDGVTMEDASISRKDHAKSLDSLKAGVKIDNKEVKIDPLVLFCRVTALLEREGKEKQMENFEFELTPEPTSLFRNGMMRKACKSTLRNHILKLDYRTEKPSGDICVVDGGAALHKTPWTLQGTYADIADAFVRYIQSKHGYNDKMHVVFDGYDDSLSLKNSEHMRRGQSTLASNVALTGDTKVTTSKESFLSNVNNKKQFIQLLCEKLDQNRIVNSVSDGDADVLIVKKAMEYAGRMKKVVVASDDTDILMMLIHHLNPDSGKVYFSTERKEPIQTATNKDDPKQKKKAKQTKKKAVPMWWDIGTLIKNESLTDVPVLLAHAWGDVTQHQHCTGEGRSRY